LNKTFFLAACLLACSDGSPEPVTEMLSPTDQLVRVSMATRGLRPSTDDLADIVADPSLLASKVDAYLTDDAFIETIRDLYAETLLMRAGFVQLPPWGPIEDDLTGEIAFSMQEEPLKLIAYVVENDLPFTEIVTADYTVIDRIGAGMWGAAYDENGPDWQVSQWDDGRPQAGILSGSALWFRHSSAGSNYHRGRANVLADALLCSNFLDRDVALSGAIDFSDDDAVAEAVLHQADCVGCHQALDGLAAHLWGYYRRIQGFQVGQSIQNGCDSTSAFCYPLEMYIPSREITWERKGLREPGYYGLSSDDLITLGQRMAADVRLTQCAVRRAYGYLTQTDPYAMKTDRMLAFHDTFEAAGFRMRPLIKAIVTDPSFLALSDEDGEVIGLQTVRPEQLTRTVEALTGFVWQTNADAPNCKNSTRGCFGNEDLTIGNSLGFAAMAGGINASTVTRATHTATPTRLMFMSALADEAAANVVGFDLRQSANSGRRLLQTSTTSTTDEASLRAEMTTLYARVLGLSVPTDSDEVNATMTLWQTVYDEDNDTDRAWTTVISALLQDNRMLFY
jgi:hypothetical protein